MSREWKPGDVATTQFGRSVVVPGTRCGHFDREPHWHHVLNGGWDPLDGHADARLLVVIDLEDADALDRLTKALVEACYAHGNTVCAENGIHPDTMQAALREFANPQPPKPDEPQGLGARVTDVDGLTWARDGDAWLPLGSGKFGRFTWDGLCRHRGPLEVSA